MVDEAVHCTKRLSNTHGSRPLATWVALLAISLALAAWGFAAAGGRAGSGDEPVIVAKGPLARGGGRGGGEAPAAFVERSRDVTRTNDFLRITFLPEGVKPTRLGGPNASWVFVGASAFYRPALPVGEIVKFPGLNYDPTQNFIAMRCIPSDPARLEPTLATWPKAADIITADLGRTYTCPPPGSASATAQAENEVYCLAKDFTDTASTTAVASVQQAVDLGAALFAVPGGDEVLRRRYGIFRAFSGLGFAVKGSGDGNPMLATDVLERSITPEYLVRNVTFADGGCSCISVPPYSGREASLLDMDFILQEGRQDECRVVNGLD